MSRDIEVEDLFFRIRATLGDVVKQTVDDVQPVLEKYGAADVFQLIADVVVGVDTSARPATQHHPDRPPVGEFAGYIELAAAMLLVALALTGLGLPVSLTWTPGTDLGDGAPVWTGIWTLTAIDAEADAA